MKRKIIIIFSVVVFFVVYRLFFMYFDYLDLLDYYWEGEGKTDYFADNDSEWRSMIYYRKHGYGDDCFIVLQKKAGFVWYNHSLYYSGKRSDHIFIYYTIKDMGDNRQNLIDEGIVKKVNFLDMINLLGQKGTYLFCQPIKQTAE